MPSELESLIDEHAPSAPAATPANPASSAPAKPTTPDVPRGTQAASPAEQRRLLKLIVDRKEEDFDLDDHWNDEAKRKDLVALLQKGKAFTRVRDDAIAERDKFVLGALKKQGFEWTEDASLEGGLKFTKAQVAAAAAEATPSEKREIQGDSLAELEAKARDGDAAAIVEWTKRENERRFKEFQEQQGKDATKREQDGKLAEYKRYVHGKASAAMDEEAAAFEGLPDEVVQAIFKAANDAAAKPGATPQHAVDYIKQRAAALRTAIDGRVKKTLSEVKPTKEAPPVHGGSPAGSGKKKPDDDDLDGLIDEAFKP